MGATVPDLQPTPPQGAEASANPTPEPEPEPQTEAQPEPQPEPKAEPEPEPQPQPEPEPEPEPEPMEPESEESDLGKWSKSSRTLGRALSTIYRVTQKECNTLRSIISRKRWIELKSCVH